MGCHGIRLDKPEGIKSKMKQFLEYPGPVIMDAQVTKESDVFPMVAPGKALDMGPLEGAILEYLMRRYLKL